MGPKISFFLVYAAIPVLVQAGGFDLSLKLEQHLRPPSTTQSAVIAKEAKPAATEENSLKISIRIDPKPANHLAKPLVVQHENAHREWGSGRGRCWGFNGDRFEGGFVDLERMIFHVGPTSVVWRVEH